MGVAKPEEWKAFTGASINEPFVNLDPSSRFKFRKKCFDLSRHPIRSNCVPHFAARIDF